MSVCVAHWATSQHSKAPVTILMGEVEGERNPHSGAAMLCRTGVQAPEERHEFNGITRRELAEPMGRVAFRFLEPRSEDGFVPRGFSTDVLRAGGVHPALRASEGGSPSTHAPPRDPS